MRSILPRATFETSCLPPRSRYEAWRNLISAVFEPRLPDDDVRQDLTAEASSVHFGQILLVNAKAEAQHFSRTRRLIASEGLDHYLVQVYRSGICEGSYGDVQNVVRPGDIKIIDLAQPFETFNTGFDNTTLTIPRAALAPLLDRPDGVHGTVLPADSPLGSVLGSHILALAAVGPDLTMTEAASLATGSVRLVAACLGANPRARGETQAYRAVGRGQAVRDFIDENIASPLLCPELLAKHFRLSRAGLYRVFADEGGVAAFIQARRLRRCFLAITDPAQAHRRFGDIAHAHGFSSDAHFGRAFRQAFGMTPGEARYEAGAIPAPSEASFINQWMRGLRPDSAFGLT